ncbi:MAG: putative manganese-dependent inorganic diphosphatase [Bacilli bacterium]
MKKTFVFGHKKPDTDSVTAAISLSYLKNALGMDTVPVVLGDINNETKFVLDYFKTETPNYLNDVKLQIKDLNYNKSNFISKSASLLETFNYMNQNMISNIPIIDTDFTYLGTASMKEIAKDIISGSQVHLSADFINIVKTLDAEEILKFNDYIEGEVVIASYKSTTFIENVDINHDTILIVGDRHSIIEYAVNNGAKMIILTGNSKIKEEHLKIAKKNKVNIIRTEQYTFQTAKIINLSKNIENIIQTENIICFDENDDVQDFISIANKTKFSNFPVIDKYGKCLGLVKLADLSEKEKKKVILVDHNEYEQSIDGLDEAEIVEIVDHHKIGSIGTSSPINFRNMPVGSSNTIVYMLFKENGIAIPENIAGLMLSGIISDTLLFASPTTTEIDKSTVKKLSKLANVDYNKYGMEMFKAGSSLKGKTEEEIFYTDFKNFTVEGKKIGISQISTVSVSDITEKEEKYISLINSIAKNNDYYILALFVTDILSNGSFIYFNDSSLDILDNCFGLELKQGKYLEGIVSRKKQVIPVIMDSFEK